MIVCVFDTGNTFGLDGENWNGLSLRRSSESLLGKGRRLSPPFFVCAVSTHSFADARDVRRIAPERFSIGHRARPDMRHKDRIAEYVLLHSAVAVDFADVSLSAEHQPKRQPNQQTPPKRQTQEKSNAACHTKTERGRGNATCRAKTERGRGNTACRAKTGRGPD